MQAFTAGPVVPAAAAYYFPEVVVNRLRILILALRNIDDNGGVLEGPELRGVIDILEDECLEAGGK